MLTFWQTTESKSKKKRNESEENSVEQDERVIQSE